MLTQWSYCSLALTHRYKHSQCEWKPLLKKYVWSLPLVGVVRIAVWGPFAFLIRGVRKGFCAVWDSLNIKTPSYQYRHSHHKVKTVVSLFNGNPMPGKTVFLLRQDSGVGDTESFNDFITWSKTPQHCFWDAFRFRKLLGNVSTNLSLVSKTWPTQNVWYFANNNFDEVFKKWTCFSHIIEFLFLRIRIGTGNKSLPVPIMTKTYDTIYHHMATKSKSLNQKWPSCTTLIHSWSVVQCRSNNMVSLQYDHFGMRDCHNPN